MPRSLVGAFFFERSGRTKALPEVVDVKAVAQETRTALLAQLTSRKIYALAILAYTGFTLILCGTPLVAQTILLLRKHMTSRMPLLT